MRQDPQERPSVELAQTAEGPPELEAGQRIAEARAGDVGRRFLAQLGQEAARARGPGARSPGRPGHPSPSVAARPSTVAATSPKSVTAEPSGERREDAHVGRQERQAMGASGRGRGRRKAAGGRRCGPASGRERPAPARWWRAAPPTRSRRSRTSVRRPALPRYAAQTRPLWPPPTTTASQPRAHLRPPSGRAIAAARGRRGARWRP